MNKIFTIISLLTIIVYSATDSYYSSINSELFISPKFLATGNSQQALSSDPSPQSNPASLTKVKNRSIAVAYSDYYSQVFSVTTIYGTLPIDSLHFFGVSFSYLANPNIPYTGKEGDTIIYKNASESFLNISYGRKIYSLDFAKFSVGGAIHSKRVNLIDYVGYGIGADIGLLAEFNNGVSTSWQVNNVTTEYTYWSGSYKELGLPQTYIALGYERKLSKLLDITLSYRTPDLFGNSGVGITSSLKEFEGEPGFLSVKSNPALLYSYANYGVEIGVKDIVYFRMGYNGDKRLSFGGGAIVKDNYSIDFTYIPKGLLEDSYSASVGYSF